MIQSLREVRLGKRGKKRLFSLLLKHIDLYCFAFSLIDYRVEFDTVRNDTSWHMLLETDIKGQFLDSVMNMNKNHVTLFISALWKFYRDCVEYVEKRSGL